MEKCDYYNGLFWHERSNIGDWRDETTRGTANFIFFVDSEQGSGQFEVFGSAAVGHLEPA